MFVKKKIQQLTGSASPLYDSDADAFASITQTSATSTSTSDQANKLSKKLIEAALLNKSLSLTTTTTNTQAQCDDNDLFTFLNQVKLNSPPRSPAPIRTRSSTSSTSSSSSSMSSASSASMSSYDYFDRLQSPIKQQQQRILNLNELKYALVNQTDPQIDMISIKLNQQKLASNTINKPKYLGPIGKPVVNELDALSQQQQILANLNSLLISQKKHANKH